MKNEIHRLEKDLLSEKTKVKALEDELKIKMNVHRWRKLEATDQESFEQILKIQTLQRRLIAKTEEVYNYFLSFSALKLKKNYIFILYYVDLSENLRIRLSNKYKRKVVFLILFFATTLIFSIGSRERKLNKREGKTLYGTEEHPRKTTRSRDS